VSSDNSGAGSRSLIPFRFRPRFHREDACSIFRNAVRLTIHQSRGGRRPVSAIPDGWSDIKQLRMNVAVPALARCYRRNLGALPCWRSTARKAIPLMTSEGRLRVAFSCRIAVTFR
jgi:hypothetical protein